MIRWLLTCLMLIAPLALGQPAEAPAPTGGDAPAGIAPDELADAAVGGDIVNVYETAVATMRKACDDYRRIKALELSVTRDLPFREAYRNINDVMPVLDPIDRELLRKPIRRTEEIEPHKAEVARVQTQVEMMIDLTAKLLEEIEKSRQVIEQALEGQRQEISLEQIVRREEYDPEAEQVEARERQVETDATMQELVELAEEDEQSEQEFKDLVEPMRRIMAAQQSLPQEQDERKEIEADPRVTGSDFIDPLKDLAEVEPEDVILGRKVGVEAGEGARWLFIDTWYTIGPFPNPRRVNLNRQFPPETVIDLDAVYAGANGQAVRWEFVQSGTPHVVPANAQEYGIWYAYTEVWLERDMDLWVAVGSDDKANIWVNNLPIWISSDRLKGWRIDEGFRKVAFRAGRNRILYRVENGWRGVLFSFGIHVGDSFVPRTGSASRPDPDEPSVDALSRAGR